MSCAKTGMSTTCPYLQQRNLQAARVTVWTNIPIVDHNGHITLPKNCTCEISTVSHSNCADLSLNTTGTSNLSRSVTP